MTVRQLHEIGIQDGGRIFVPRWRCGFMSRRLSRLVARSGHSRVGLINPGRLSRETHNEGDDYHGCKRCREPKQSQPGIGSLVHFPFAFSSFRRIRMDFTGRLRFAEINTHDFPALIRSSKRRFSSGVHLVPRCCTAIRNATVLFSAPSALAANGPF